MKFGIFDHIEPFPGTPIPKLYKQRLEFIKLADEGGITGYHAAEHHGSELCVAPNQETFLAAAAMVTSRIRLGTLVKCLPLHHPLEVVEDICMLDNLSDGRLDYGVGRGIIAVDHLFFGHDWKQGKERFNEALEIVIRGLRTGKVSSEGCKHFDIPTVETGMSTIQAPNPPFWSAGDPVEAGARGMTCLITGRVTPEIRQTYLDAWNAHHGEPGRADGPDQAPMIGSGTEMVAIAPTTAEAYEIAVRGRVGLRRRIDAAKEYGMQFLPEEDRAAAASTRVPVRADPTAGIPGPESTTPAPSGTLEMVRDYYVQYAEEGNCDYITMLLETGDMTHKESMRTLAAVCEHIIPAVEKVSR